MFNLKFKLIILLILFSVNVFSKDYYVSTSGDDSFIGTELEPFRTIQKASDLASSGDNIYIFSGIYNEQVVLENSGTELNKIIFTNHPSNVEDVIISGNGIVIDNGYNPYSGLVNFTDIQNVVFKNIVIENSPKHGIYATRKNIKPSNIIIKNLIIRNSSNNGVYIKNSNNVTVENIEVLNSGLNNKSAAAILFKKSQYVTVKDSFTDESTSSGIGIWKSKFVNIINNTIEDAMNTGKSGEEFLTISSVDGFLVKGNEVYAKDGPSKLGIDIKNNSRDGEVSYNYIHDLIDKTAIYIDPYDSNILENIRIHHNKIENTGKGISLTSEAGGTLANVWVNNNYISNILGNGISIARNLGSCNCGNGLRKNIYIENNTILKNSTNAVVSGIGIFSENIENIVVRNNIVFQPTQRKNVQTFGYFSESPVGEILSSNNIAFGLSNSYDFPFKKPFGIIKELPNLTYVDPKFVNPQTLNGYLSYDSPAIDTGEDTSANGIISDFDDMLRPLDGDNNGTSNYDIGAFEYKYSQTNTPPVALFTVSESSGTVPFDIYVDANDSYDIDGSIVEYRWELSDGQVKTGDIAVFTLTELGDITIKLTVIDNSGNEDTIQKVVTVNEEVTTYLIKLNSNWDYFKGLSEPPVTWKEVAFEEQWINNQASIGYGDDDDFTILADMRGLYSSVYIRKVFIIEDLEVLMNLFLEIKYDDGFVAYLNGEEILRSKNMGAPGSVVRYSSLASYGHEARKFEVFDMTDKIPLLHEGENVLAIQGHNKKIRSSDFTLDAGLNKVLISQ